MILSGFTDEAGQSLETQIQATQALGWKHISARSINGTNIHDLSESEFSKTADQLDAADIQVYEFGSLIGNWAKSIDTDFSLTLAEIERAIPRMQRLGTQFVRIMSYAQEPWGEDQKEAERFRRLREIVARFQDAGLQALHENCMNWGGFSAAHSLKLIEEVPGLRLIFDTGNPVFQLDRSQTKPYPWQNALEFYRQIKAHVAHIHIKDCLNPLPGKTEPERYTLPGQGQAQLDAILNELQLDDYQGAYSIEPHVATVFHQKSEAEQDPQHNYQVYLDYGRAFQARLEKARSQTAQ